MEEENEEIAFENKKGKMQTKNIFLKILVGDLFEDFIIKQSKMILWVFFLILVFISNRYSCSKKLAEIRRLTAKLELVKYENLSLSTEITTRSRQIQLEDMLKEKGINLEMAKTPAIEIHR
ncbi:MAG: hypothetical protein LBH32_00895 [Dysgonamonadaceae bacterium]|jgi:cell division protein FtsL|nr:hypothetical protein [Dysgonamonadaceae bacterium]